MRRQRDQRYLLSTFLFLQVLGYRLPVDIGLLCDAVIKSVHGTRIASRTPRHSMTKRTVDEWDPNGCAM
jgi:hypothetical protein